MNLVEKAFEIASKAHEGQKRRDGKTEYISHPLAVREIVFEWLGGNVFDNRKELNNLIYWARQEVLAFGINYQHFTDILEIVSLNHDAGEGKEQTDRGFTIDWVISQLKKYDYDYSPIFLLIVEKSLNALTHREEESYLDYILRAKKDRIARIIKIADITHNISTRNGSNTAGEIKRDKIAIDKYKLAEYILLN